MLVLALLVLTVIGVIAFTSRAGSGPPESTVLWSGGFDDGTLAEFQDAPFNFVGVGAPEVVPEPSREGSAAARFSLGPGGRRQELVAGAPGGPPVRFGEGDERYFAFSTRFGERWPVVSTWQVVAQWKADGDGGPPLGILAGSWGRPRVVLAAAGWPGGGSQEHHDLGPLVRGEWIDWVVRIRFSADPGDSEVQVWRGGDEVLDKRGWRPSFGGEDAGSEGGTLRRGRLSYLKHGIYRDPQIAQPAELWTDRWVIGTPRG